jgi:hypothetical protein
MGICYKINAYTHPQQSIINPPPSKGFAITRNIYTPLLISNLLNNINIE